MTTALQNKPQLVILVALACEAKPIVDHLRLRKLQNTVFPHYVDRDNASHEVATGLVVSGIGALNMAAAAAWIGAQFPDGNLAWLNVGIAGHQSLQVGDCMRVVGCLDVVTQRIFHPPLVAKWSGQNTELLSCNAATDDYPKDQAVDMEAGAFFATASKFSSLEFVQSIKVVSDNPDSPAQRLNASLISDLIEPHVISILQFARSMVELLPPIVEPVKLPASVLALHCTASQEIQLKEFCRKLQSVGFSDNRIAVEIAGLSSMQAILQVLECLQLTTAPELGAVAAN